MTAEPSDDLGRLLWALRAYFADVYDGWIPVLGKNRPVSHVHGVGEISVGGTGDPTMIQPDATASGGGADPHRVVPGDIDGRPDGPGAGARVGVLDTALYPHPWLAGAWTGARADLLRSEETPLAVDGHATFVSGLILRQAPGAVIQVHRALDGNGTADAWSVATKIVQLATSGIDVLNLSFACYTEDGQAPLVLATAIDLVPPDVVVVAAAGNRGANTEPAWPAALGGVIAVGALDADGKRASFSPEQPWVNITARGVDVLSTFLPAARVANDGSTPLDFGEWAVWSGTSFAAAVVTGQIASRVEAGQRSARRVAAGLLTGDEDGDWRTPPSVPITGFV